MENGVRVELKEFLQRHKEGEPLPKYIITAIHLPTGAVEIITNSNMLYEKAHYLLETYDEDMCMKHNQSIYISNIMIVY